VWWERGLTNNRVAHDRNAAAELLNDNSCRTIAPGYRSNGRVRPTVSDLVFDNAGSTSSLQLIIPRFPVATTIPRHVSAVEHEGIIVVEVVSVWYGRLDDSASSFHGASSPAARRRALVGDGRSSLRSCSHRCCGSGACSHREASARSARGRGRRVSVREDRRDHHKFRRTRRECIFRGAVLRLRFGIRLILHVSIVYTQQQEDLPLRYHRPGFLLLDCTLVLRKTHCSSLLQNTSVVSSLVQCIYLRGYSLSLGSQYLCTSARSSGHCRRRRRPHPHHLHNRHLDSRLASIQALCKSRRRSWAQCMRVASSGVICKGR
jgi:hypothetical protein